MTTLDFSNITIRQVKNLRWFNAEKTVLLADVDFSHTEEEFLPFACHADFDRQYGVDLFNEALAGDHGEIADFIDTPIEEKREQAATLNAAQIRLGLIGEGITPADVQEYIDDISDATEKAIVDTLWNYGHTFKRTDEQLTTHLAGLGIDDETADKIFGIE